MKHLRRIGLVLIFVLLSSSAFAAQDPAELMEKAIYAEETLGNLSEAIGIYQQVAADAKPIARQRPWRSTGLECVIRKAAALRMHKPLLPSFPKCIRNRRT